MDKIFRNKKAITIFIMPAFILFTLILFIPIFQAVYYSFCDYGALGAKAQWVGLKNYVTLFTTDAKMKWALKNSLFFMIFSSITQQIIGFLTAILLTNIKIGRNFFKNIYYLPCVLSSAALGLLWAFLFMPKTGINNLLPDGVTGPNWMSDVSGFIPLPIWVISFVALWQYVGQNMMLYMAQITGISKDLYEAAYIDGANKRQAAWYITVPLSKPMLKTTLSLNCIGSLKFFDLVYNMTQGGQPAGYTHVLATHLYQMGFENNKLGYSAAISVILLILCLVMTVVIDKCIKAETYEG